MRVLIASKILVVAAYRRKLDEIAALPDIEHLVAVAPPAWREPYLSAPGILNRYFFRRDGFLAGRFLGFNDLFFAVLALRDFFFGAARGPTRPAVFGAGLRAGFRPRLAAARPAFFLAAGLGLTSSGA